MDIAEESSDDRRTIHPIRSDSSSLSSPDSAVVLTPASTAQGGGGGGGGDEEDGGPADPLLRVGQDEVFELHEGVGRSKSTAEGLLFDEEDYYHDDDEDDEDAGEDEDDDIVYTADEERAVVRKFDRRLVLFVALLYLLSFLDRSSECFVFLFLFLAQVFLSSFLFWDWCLDSLILPAYDRWFCILPNYTKQNNFRVPSAPPPQGCAVAFSCIVSGIVENVSAIWKENSAASGLMPSL